MNSTTVIPRLQLRLLGAPSVTLAGNEVTGFTSAKVHALFFYLAVTKETHRRSSLAALLWPNANEQKAHTSLRNALATLRKLLPEHIDIGRHSVALRRDDLWLDTEQFTLLLKRTDDPMADARRRQTAISLYAGEFLAGFHVSYAPSYESWVAATREQFHQAMIGALMDMAQWHAVRQDHAAALDSLTYLLAIEPGSEAAHRLKMRVLARMGQRSAAILQFDTCRRYLAEELGVDPEAETVALYGLLLEGGNEGDLSPKSAVGESARNLPVPVAPMNTFPTVAWGDMPARVSFFGRPQRLAKLMAWLTDEKCALVVVSGMGGVGKTALATELVHRLAALPTTKQGYTHIVWRSLVNAPPLAELVDGWLRVLVQPPPERVPASLDDKLALLFSELQSQRCLLILDNVETIMGHGVSVGSYRPGYGDYRQLTERMANGRHQSCLLMTTRELPKEIGRLARDYPAVQAVTLSGLATDHGVELLHAYGIKGSDTALTALVARYSGNPLALKLVAATVNELYAGEIDVFLAGETLVFEDIRDVLDQHFARLSDLERTLLYWLAVERVPVGIHELWDDLVAQPARGNFLEAIHSLRRSSLLVDVVEDTALATAPDSAPDPDAGEDLARLALQNVVMEYVSDRLLHALYADLDQARVEHFHLYALRKANAREYVQDVQRRLLLEPLAQHMVRRYGTAGALQRLRSLRDQARWQERLTHGYIAANVFHLMEHLQVDMTGEDFSRVSLRQADLRRVSLRNVNLRGADLASTKFADDFGGVIALAISPDGEYLAAGADRDVVIWRTRDLQPHLVLHGHSHHVSAIAFAPNSGHLAGASLDGTLHVWDVASGQLVHTILAERGTLRAIAFSPDGQYLVGAGEAQVIWVWNWPSADLRSGLPTGDTVLGLAFTPTGELLASIGYSGDLQCWDVEAQTLLYSLRGKGSQCQALTISADGALAVAGSQDNLIYVWDLRRRELSGVLKGHAAWILAAAISPDGVHVASAGADASVRMWDVRTGQLVRILEGHRGWVRALTFTHDGQDLVSGGYDQTVRIWKTQSGLQLRRLQGSLRWVSTLIFSLDGKYLAGTTLAGEVYVWDAHDLRPLHIRQGDGSPIRALAFSPTGRVFATGSDDGSVYICDVQTGARLHTLPGHQGFVRAVAFDGSGRYLASGSLDHTIRLWDVMSGHLLRVVPNVNANIMHALVFSPRDDVLAYGDGDGAVHLFALDLGRTIHSMPNTAVANVLAFCRDGKRLACAARDGSVTVWDLATTADGIAAVERCRLHHSPHRAWRLRFSPDGAYLAWNREGMDIDVLDVATGEALYCIPGNHNAFGLESLPGGHSLITDGPDHGLVIYDTATGAVRTRLEGHTSDLTSIEISPCGSTVAVSDVSGMVRLWEPVSGAALATTHLYGPYHGMNITGATGLTQGQLQALTSLGAIVD